MINNSLLLRTAGKYPSIQVRERSAWVRDFPDVPRSNLDASGIPDGWKAGNLCPRNSHERGSRGRLFNSEKIKPRAASPSPGRSTRVAQDRGAARTATRHVGGGLGAFGHGEAGAAAGSVGGYCGS